jgi:hypothetical protein
VLVVYLEIKVFLGVVQLYILEIVVAYAAACPYIEISVPVNQVKRTPNTLAVNCVGYAVVRHFHIVSAIDRYVGSCSRIDS